MAYTPSFGTQGWQPEQPMVISRGEYKLYDDDAIYLGQPVEIDAAHGTSGVDTTDGNKVWVQPYSAADGSNKCIGISMTNKLDKGNANAERAGMGGYRRDLRLFQYGLIPMLNVGGGALALFDEVMVIWNSGAGVSGVKAAASGGYVVGKVFQQEIPDGKFGMIFIDLKGDVLP